MSPTQRRENMLNNQVRTWGVKDIKLLEIISDLPRENFVPSKYKELAYTDTQIPLYDEQAMLEPKSLAKAIEALNINSEDTVLEFGCGSGYATAILASLSAYVISYDIKQNLIDLAKKHLSDLNINNVEFHCEDIATNCNLEKKVDVIFTTGSFSFIPEQYKKLVENGGRIFAIVGQKPCMQAMLYTNNNGSWTAQALFETNAPRLLNTDEPEEFRF